MKHALDLNDNYTVLQKQKESQMNIALYNYKLYL